MRTARLKLPGLEDKPWADQVRTVLSAFRETPKAVRLVLEADRSAAFGIMSLAFLSSLLPLALAWIGKLLVDGVLAAAKGADPLLARRALTLVGIELGLMLASGLIARSSNLLRTVLANKLGYLINIRILEKALTLDLWHFESPEVYDKLQNARREASGRPLNLFVETVEIVGSAITLVSYGVMLVRFSGWTLLILAAAVLPAFIAEARFSGESYRLLTWRAPEGRRMRYLESLLSRDDNAKEVKLYGLGPLVMRRYRALYETLFGEERKLAIRRASWGFSLGAISTVALYGCSAWIVARTVAGELTLGDMTLYVVVFRQGQAALRSILFTLGTTYEDNLFMANLFEFFAIPTSIKKPQLEWAPEPPPAAPGTTRKGASFALEGVSFSYPGTDKRVLEDLNLTIGPGEKLAIVGENGAGKTTLIKLLTGLYPPSQGQIKVDGVPLAQIPPEEIRRRFGVVFQDYVHYQFSARDNVGVGRPERIEDLALIEAAAEKGGARAVIAELPKGWDTQLGRWFEDGVQLSQGNWQKIAVSRAFMRDADILVLDEPTASLDAEAEHALFQRFRQLTEGKTALLISHRFSTVRMADRIAVLQGGKITELGSHDELLARDGKYARMFKLQAEGYA